MGEGTNNKSKGDWQSESLRVTAFPGPGVLLGDPPSWWEAAVGEPPENRVSQPRVSVVQEQGTFSNGTLTLIIQPARIDWVYARADQADVGWPFEDSVNSFVPLITCWLADAPALERIAFGAVLRMSVDNRIDGYKRLSTFLPNVKLDPEGSTEFLFQINRPRKSRVIEDLSINRLSKWSVALTRQIIYSAQPPQAAQFRVTDQQEEVFCRLELDVNTAPNSEGDLSPHLTEIFDELVELSKEIATKGDTP